MERSEEVEDLRRRLMASEAALAEARERLERQDEFFQMAVHDLRTPLSAIVVYAELLMNRVLGDLDDRQIEPIRTIHRNCNNLIRMAEDVLVSARLRAGRLQPDFQIVQLADVASEAVATVSGLADAKNIRIDLERGEVPTVLADPDKLGRAVTNVLGNAIKYSPQGGHILVGLAWGKDEMTISISDSGPGISPEKREAIFRKFQRGEHGGEEGHGLGLAIAKYFIDLHHGRILVESVRSRGSTFLIGIPRHRSS